MTSLPGRHTGRPRWYRRRDTWAVIAGVAVTVTALSAVAADTFTSTDGPAPPEPVVATAAPTSPPARICDNAAVLDGPDRPPEGAVVVEPGDDLDQATRANPEGTTFWLAPGTHRLPPEQYAQVTPKDGNTYVGAPGAVLDGARTNQYAFSGDAQDVTISHLTVLGFGAVSSNNDEGVVNHDSAAGWTIEASTIRDNAGAGIMLGSGNVVRDSCLRGNGQYGFNAYHPDGITDLTLERNEVTDNNTDDWETQRPGCGCTGGGKFWDVDGATVADNWVHANRGVGLWADTNNRGFAFTGNYIEANQAEGIMYEISYNALVQGNTFVRNGLVKGPTNPAFPTSAIFLSESGSDPRVPGPYGKTLDVVGNVFVDNWSGIVLWENADRFAGSPSNTSTGVGTLVNPEEVTADTCNEANVGDPPYRDDCRWKTQNVRVSDNVFRFSPSKVGPECGAVSGCGYNGVFANWGSWPPWSPYQGPGVSDAITYDQHNVFSDNTYIGPWRFMAHEMGNVITFDTWQGDPYGQDAGSTMR